ncbi:MAG: RidA family protein [Thermodesulfobacteriota bacterium]
MNIEDKLEELGINLNDIPKPLGSYKPGVISGNLLFISGQLPLSEGKLLFEGKVEADISLDQAMLATRQCAVNSLSIIKGELGDLNKVKRIVKVTGYVASSQGFYKQANVVNGASDLYYEVFGEKGVHARAAVGVYELPLNSPVEVEVIVEIKS